MKTSKIFAPSATLWTTSTTESTLRNEAASTRLSIALGHDFDDPALLQLALAHRSWCAEHNQPASNERLEFLGDAVLGMVVADEVYRRFPELPEGKLAKLRAGVVNANALADIARQVNLGDAMLLGKGERTTGGADKQSILADALEAVIGAVHLDAGLEVATSMIVRLFGPMIEETALQGPGGRDHKTRLQELAVAFSDVPPAYRIAAEGPDHARMFNADVIVADEVLGSGTGSSKKEAEQQAAGQAVEALQARISAGDSAVEPATGSHASTAESPAEDSSTDLSNPKSGAETAAQAVVDAQTESTTERRAS